VSRGSSWDDFPDRYHDCDTIVVMLSGGDEILECWWVVFNASSRTMSFRPICFRDGRQIHPARVRLEAKPLASDVMQPCCVRRVGSNKGNVAFARRYNRFLRFSQNFQIVRQSAWKIVRFVNRRMFECPNGRFECLCRVPVR
jgi:hypothetical protein